MSTRRPKRVVPFIAEGLARGERCVYIADLDQRDALLGALSNAGVNASRALDRGSLWLRSPQEIYFRSGKFDPDDMLALVDELITSALADGFVGVRGSGEASAAQDHDGTSPGPTSTRTRSASTSGSRAGRSSPCAATTVRLRRRRTSPTRSAPTRPRSSAAASAATRTTRSPTSRSRATPNASNGCCTSCGVRRPATCARWR